MKILNRIIRIISQFITASISALILSETVRYIYLFYEDYLPTSFYLAFFLGAPLGSVLGVYIVERIFYKSLAMPSWVMISSFWISILGVFLVMFTLPIHGLDLFEWFLALLGRRIDKLVFILSASLFCILGYNCVKFIFERVHNAMHATNIEEDKIAELQRKSHRLITRRRVAFVAFCVSIILVFLGIVFREKVFNREPKARAFLEQIIKSINEDTNLHKEEFQGITWRNRDPSSYLDQVSSNYQIMLVKSDFDKGGYEYTIIFDDKTKFFAVVVDYGKRFSLEEFQPEGSQ